MKGLVDIAPHGAVTFISSLYSGCMSDVEITKLSGLLNLMENGDQIMANKGFVLNNILKGTGVNIATPHFLCADGQFTPSQIEDNQKLLLSVFMWNAILKGYRNTDCYTPLYLCQLQGQSTNFGQSQTC